MSEVKWTDEQKAVIDFRGGNLLVSAAAGSGKTAVLIEHIVSQITDPVNPLSVTELLVVTFTRAAAGEMRSRLSEKLTECLDREPGNVHLRRQIPLLAQAHISTIDSFCGWMVRNYFHQLDIDPDYRVMDEGEKQLMQEDAAEEILEEAYEASEEDFIHFMDAFASEQRDEAVRKMILRVAACAESQPWPEEWLDSLSGAGDDYLEELTVLIRSRLEGICRRAEIGRMRAAESAGMDKYEAMFAGDRQKIQSVCDVADSAAFLQALGAIALDSAPRITKADPCDPSVKASLQEWRKKYKEDLKSLSEAYGADPEEEREHERRCRRDERVLIRLTKAFRDRFQEKKAEGNLADFSDVEHLALDLLIRREDGASVETPLAEELGKTFREIIVDEYQDSNMVQEQILRTLSGERRGNPNMFMVGDVKQSIYKFRMAKPELFMEKYRRFQPLPAAQDAGKDSPGEHPEGYVIDLGRNFRSRNAVLTASNRLFRRVMRRELGGVDYDERAMLHYGAAYPETDPEAELILIGRSDAVDAVETEAAVVADKIRSLMDPESGFQIYDRKKNEMRPPAFRDFVILTRSVEGWADRFAQVLNREGIPAFAQLKSGYFAAPEVQILLNFLRVLDNPGQDIPLASVLLSPLGGFDEETLAQMLAGTPSGTLYERLDTAAEQGRYPEIWRECRDRIERFRSFAELHPIHETLEEVLTETDAGVRFAARAGGAVRMANIEMLMEMAMRFEETSYRGIFRFLRYIDQLEKYSMDFGEAQVLSENEDLVRITTIHKSKGLEYPVVFVSGCGKQFNLTDTREAMLIHEERGLACDDIDPERAVRYRTMRKRGLALHMQREIKGEELRVLYVAMTRAKEKLILTGSCRDPEQLLEKWDAADPEENDVLPDWQIESANGFLDWLVMANQSCGGELFRQTILSADAEEEAAGEKSRDLEARQRIEELLGGEMPDELFHREFVKTMSYQYPYREIVHQKPAVSVSELKHIAARLAGAEPMETAETGAGSVHRAVETGEARQMPEEEKTAGYTEEEKLTPGSMQPVLPSELGNDAPEVNPGALRGTAYHLVLEIMPPALGADADSVRDFMRRAVQDGLMSGEEADRVDPEDIAAYYASELGRLAIRCHESGRLFLEQPFIMRADLADIRRMTEADARLRGMQKEEIRMSANDEDSGDWILVQGIIDAFAEVDGELILWDYKTDRVPKRGGETMLKERYREQLLRYAKALEDARGQRVREMWIYSFALNRCIRLDGQGLHPDGRM